MNNNTDYLSPEDLKSNRKVVYLNSNSEYICHNLDGSLSGIYNLPEFKNTFYWVYNRFDNMELSVLGLIDPDNPEDIIVEYVNFNWMWASDNSAVFFGVKDGKRYKKWSNNGIFPYSNYYDSDGIIRTNQPFVLPSNALEVYVSKGNNILNQVNRLSNNDEYPVYKCNVLDVSKFNNENPSNTDFILTEDVYLDGYCLFYGVNNRFILDGGNLIRYYNNASLPNNIICSNNNITSKIPPVFENLEQTFISGSIIKYPSATSQLLPLSNNGIYEIILDPSNFILTSDYIYVEGKLFLDLNSILERITKSIYQQSNVSDKNILIRFPENNYGNGFYIHKTFDLPYGMSIDFGNANIWISNHYLSTNKEQSLNFKSTLETQNSDISNFNYVFGFTRNFKYPSIVKGTIKNTTIHILDDVSPEQLRIVLNIRHFSGLLENVNFNISNFSGDQIYPQGPYVLAIWQPLAKFIDGFGHESYSDQKLIRKCVVTCPSGRVNTPTVILSNGDGVNIQNCNLGYVAILGGKGCIISSELNSKYFIFNSSVNFVNVYFEISQFEILNSEIKFSSGHIQCENNILGLDYYLTNRKYFGPWFAIDMEFSKKRLRYFLKQLYVNCNDSFWEKETSSNKYYRYKKQLRYSTIKFDPTITCETIYWGYRQPMSGELFVKNIHSRIFGMTNFESIQRIFPRETHSTLAVYIPLINNTFFNWNTCIDIPENIQLEVSENQHFYSDMYYLDSGSLWEHNLNKNQSIPTIWNNIEIFIEIDSIRKLRSRSIIDNNEYCLFNGAFPSVKVNVSNEKELINLKVVLRCAFNGTLYEAKLHFKRLNYISDIATDTPDSDTINNQIIPLNMFTIADFNIMKAVEPTEKCFRDTDFNINFYNEYGYNKKIAYKHTYGNFEAIDDNHSLDNYNECIKIIPLNRKNIRAYVKCRPKYGEWLEGDEIVIKSDNSYQWLKYIDSQWIETV